MRYTAQQLHAGVKYIMRAKEFIAEQHREVSGEHYFPLPLPSTEVIPAADRYYHMYRFGVAMSRAPDEDDTMNPTTLVANQLTLAPYSKEEQAIIDRAKKLMGYSSKSISNKGTKEEDGGNATSPVAKYVPTRRST
jgi:hypothetical protein